MSKKNKNKNNTETKVIKATNNFSIVQHSGKAYTFAIASTYPSFDELVAPTNAYEFTPMNIGGFQVIPYGLNNTLPTELRKIIDDYNLGEGIFKRQRNLIFGQGPALYKIEIKDGKRVKSWFKNEKIETWLKSWAFEEYLLEAIVNYTHMEGTFTKIFQTKAGRIGLQPKIARLENVPVHQARLEFPPDKKNVKRILVAPYWDYPTSEITVYNVWDKNNPFANAVSMVYSNISSFARDFYNYPSHYGNRHWMQLSGKIPQVLNSLTDNSLNVRFHVTSPASYWSQKRELLQQQTTLEGKQWNENILDEFKDAMFTKLAEVMSGIGNVGKFFTSETVVNEFGHLEGWKIEPIDQKIKDFVDSQIEIAKHADSATTSGLGLPASLANIMVEGKLASGSEKLYDFKLFLATETDIPEKVICKTINDAIEINFPEENTKLGFYHEQVMTEEQTKPEDRTKNN